jgi:hypothetical protein
MNAKSWRFFVIALIFMCLPAANAIGEVQAPDIEWERSYGGSGTDWPHAIQQTKDGGYIVAGGSDSKDGDVIGNHGSNDFWVVKLDHIGDIVWQRSLGGSESDVAYSIQQTSDEGYILAGHSSSSDGDVTQNRGSLDGWVVKLDSNGEIEWQKTYGGSKREWIFDIFQTTDKGYVFVGDTYSNDGDISGHHSVFASDCWVVKLDSNGAIEWQRLLGGKGDDGGGTIRQTKDGGYIVAARSGSSDGDVLKKLGAQDLWIIKLNPNGGIAWQKIYGGPRDDQAMSIQQTTDNGYIVGGHSASSNGDVSSNNGIFDYWIIKLDIEGNIVWQRSFGGKSMEMLASAQQTEDEGYIIAGQSHSNDGDVTGNHGGSDYWAVKLNAEGDLVWQKSLGGSRFDRANSIQQTSDGGYIIVGDSLSKDGDVSRNHGREDFWIVKLKPEQ